MGPGRNTGLDAILGHRCFAGQSSTVSLFFAACSASLSHDCAMSRSESLAEGSLTRCTPRCRCFRIFDLHPMRRSARAYRARQSRRVALRQTKVGRNILSHLRSSLLACFGDNERAANHRLAGEEFRQGLGCFYQSAASKVLPRKRTRCYKSAMWNGTDDPLRQ